MGAFQWISQNWFELAQTGGIVAGLVFSAHSVRQDARARRVGNFIEIKQQYSDLWRQMYERSGLSRVLKVDVDLFDRPVTEEERLFVKLLLLHLDAVRRAKSAGIFLEIEGLRRDIREFLSLPIPRAVWLALKPFQDKEFVTFLESVLD